MPTKYYVFDDNKLKAEGMTKEQIINAIAEATGVTPQDVDEGFISTIVETNRSRSLHIWKGTQAEYNALETHDPATFYIIEDDTAIEDLQTDVETINDRIDNATSDSGWVEIKKTNTSNEQEIIGYYRTVGKTVYYKFSIHCDHFDDLQFEIPIAIDIVHLTKISCFDTLNHPAIAVYWLFSTPKKFVIEKENQGDSLSYIAFCISGLIYQ